MPQQPRTGRKAAKAAQKRKTLLWGRVRLDVVGGAIHVTSFADSEQDKMLARLVEQILPSELNEGSGSMEEALLKAHQQGRWHFGAAMQVDLNASMSRRHDEIVSHLLRLLEERPLSVWTTTLITLDGRKQTAVEPEPCIWDGKPAIRRVNSWVEKPSRAAITEMGHYFGAYFDPQARAWFTPSVPAISVGRRKGQLREPPVSLGTQREIITLIDLAIERCDIRDRLVEALARRGMRFFGVEIVSYRLPLSRVVRVDGAAGFFQNLVLAFLRLCESGWPNPSVADYEGTWIVAELSAPVGATIDRALTRLPPINAARLRENVASRALRALARTTDDVPPLMSARFPASILPGRQEAHGAAFFRLIMEVLAQKHSVREELSPSQVAMATWGELLADVQTRYGAEGVQFQYETSDKSTFVNDELGQPHGGINESPRALLEIVRRELHNSTSDVIKGRISKALEKFIADCNNGWAHPTGGRSWNPENGERVLIEFRPVLCYLQKVQPEHKHDVRTDVDSDIWLPTLTAAELRLQKLMDKVLPDRGRHHLDEIAAILQEARKAPPVHRVQFCRDVNLLLDVFGVAISVSVNNTERPSRLAVNPSTDEGSIQFRGPSGDTFGGFMAEESRRNGPGRPPVPRSFSIKGL